MQQAQVKDVGDKILKYEQFLNDKLLPDLKAVFEERDKLYTEQAEFLALQNSIDAIKAAKLREGEPLKVQTDLGCNFYVNARVSDPSKIFVEVGLGFHLELTLDEALQFIDKRVTLLKTQSDKLTGDANKIKANIQLVRQGLRELQNISAEPEEPKHRDIF